MNAQTIAGFADGAFDIAIGAFFFLGQDYVVKQAPALGNKRWLFRAAGAFSLIYGLMNIAGSFQTYRADIVPTASVVLGKIADAGVSVSKDEVYESQDGYKILIPAGYRYVNSGLGAGLSLLAVKPPVASLAITRQKDTNQAGDIGVIFQEACAALRSRNSTYACGATTPIHAGSVDGLRAEIDVVKPTGRAHGIMALVGGHGDVYQVMLAGPQESFGVNAVEFEKILSSFAVK